MRKNIYLLLVLFLPLISCNDEVELKVVSLNIRYDNPSDGDNTWQKRKDIVVGFLEERRADIFGLQEALLNQYTYIDSTLVDYKSIAAGRDDGEMSGEMTPVFYNSKRFRALDNDTFWLSETPGSPGSKGWGAVLPRIVTWVKLYDKRSKEEFYFFNTHLSHMSDSARLMSSMILADEVMRISGDSRFIITGDFNMLPESKAYLALTRGEGNLISDTYLISNSDPEGALYTFNGFNNKPGSGRIDYVFVRSGMVVKSLTIDKRKSGDLYISDHWPIEVSLAWSYR